MTNTKFSAIALAVLLLSSSLAILSTSPIPANAEHFSPLTDDELIAEFSASSETFRRIARILDEAGVADVTDQSTLALRNKVSLYVQDGDVKPNLLAIIDAARIKISDAKSFINDLNEQEANNMLTATDNIIIAFISAVEAEKGKKISAPVADELINDASKISSDLKKRGRELAPIIQGLQLSTVSLLFDRSETEIVDIQHALTELKERGFDVQVEARSDSPIRLIIRVLKIAVDVKEVFDTRDAALAVTNAVNESLLQDGLEPLNTYEEFGLFLLNVALYEALSIAVDTATAKLLFEDVGLFFNGEITAKVLVGRYASNELNRSIFQLLPLEDFEKQLILFIRDVYANKITGSVFIDTNDDGVFGPGIEPPKQGWKVDLLNSDRSIAITFAETESNGLYTFSGLIDGSYWVDVRIEIGWISTAASSIGPIQVKGGRDSANNDFGIFQLGKLGGIKFKDTNGDGEKGNGIDEPVIPGWNIMLFKGLVQVDLKPTGGDGSYIFTDLRGGSYRIVEEQRDGYVPIKPADGSYETSVFSGTNNVNFNFANQPSVQIINQDFQVFCNPPFTQICNPPFSITVQTGSVLQMQFFDTGHCSSVRLHIFVDGTLVHTTGFLGWNGATGEFANLPRDTGIIDLGPVSPGIHQLSLQAEGQVSGCNTGAVGAWGGRLLVIT